MEPAKTKIPSSKGNISAVIHYSKHKINHLAILCPGYLDSKDYSHLVKLAEDLCEKGYTVVRFDPTGTWESEGNISDYTMTQYLEDVKNIINYMFGQSSYTHILVGGHSRGGQVSILYAAQDPRISLVLGIMPSPRGFIEEERRKEWQKTGIRISFRDLPENKDEKKEFRVPFSHIVDGERYDAIKAVKKIKVPTIFIAGELDDTVTPEDVREIFNNANEPKKWLLLKNIGHDYRHNDEEIKIVNREITKLIDSVKL